MLLESTRTTLSYLEKKETLSVECENQGLSIENKTGRTSELKFGISELRERGNRFPAAQLIGDQSESTNTTLLQSRLDALLSLKDNMGMAQALPKPPSL